MNRNFFTIIFVILFSLNIILGITAAEKSKIEFNYIAKEEGLTSPYISGLYQDRHGFIWIGSYHSAIYRYDGTNMKVYRHNPSDPTSLPAVQYGKMYLDNSNIMWVATNNGLVSLDLNTEHITYYSHNPDDPDSISPGNIFALYEDPEGRLWLASEDGLNVLNKQTGKFHHYRNNPDDPDSLANNVVFTLAEDKTGTLWIGTAGGADTVNRETGKFTHYKNNPSDPGSLSNDIVFSIISDSTGTLWFSTGFGLNAIEPGQKNFRKYYLDIPNSPIPPAFYMLYEGSVSGKLWVPVMGIGLYEFDRKTEKFAFVAKPDPEDLHSLGTAYIMAMLEDKSGMLWIGGAGGFLNTVKLVKKEFYSLEADQQDPEGFHGMMPKDFVEDNTGLLWIPSLGGGLQVLDRSTGKIIKRYVNNPDDPDSLSSNAAHSVYIDKTGAIWVGTEAGINRLDKATGKFTHYTEGVTCALKIMEDSSGEMWAAGWAGLSRFDKKLNKFVLFESDPNDPKTIRPGGVLDMYEDNTGIIWGGIVYTGLVLYDRKTGGFSYITHDPTNPASLSNNDIFNIFEDSKHNLWVATAMGLNRYNRETGDFTIYTDEDGLGSSTVYKIQEDSKGNLWIVTTAGLSKYDPIKNTFRNYDTSDGLLGGDYYGRTYKSKDGIIFFGGNGINYFDPLKITENPYLPPVVITELKLFNKTVPIGEIKKGRKILTKSVTETNQIEFLYSDYVFSFEFSALSFVDAAKNQYAYMMEGFEENWNYIGTRNYATYTNLNAGNYTFRVKASNNDGKWNEEGVSLKIKVLPPFWETWWFRMLLVIFSIMLVAGIFIYAIIKLKMKHKAQMIKQEVEIARNIQTSLLPDLSRIDHNDYDIEANMTVAEMVGGDYYDVLRGKDGRLWLGIGDVTGHGISAGLIMMMAQVGIHNLLKNIPGISPVDLLIQVNKTMTDNIRMKMKSQQHMTINFLVEKEPGHFEYAGAHEVILIHRAKTGEVIQVDTEGFWLGILEDCSLQMSNGKGSFQLDKEDTLLLYTDGLIEIMNKEHKQFDIKRLMSVMRNNCENPRVLKDAINNAIIDFGGIQTDDITYLICQRK